ncbi:hypothetical protein ACFXO2_41200 [Streptomyces sp. NPDC059152]|uniref:hypothetical protein n=1 Tax=Streptomyces sp. NPDC059152 TaxID=3346742 RepID=UPI0036CDADAA
MSNVVVTIAGGSVATTVVVLSVKTWWKGNRELKSLVPYAGGLVTGSSWTLCAGGVLGAIAVQGAEMSNKVGEKAINLATGKQGPTALNQGDLGTLTYGGACVVLIGTIVGFIALKAAGKADKKRMLGGVLAGITLCATAGFSSAMQWVPDLYNTGGTWLTDALNGTWSL